jgi:hypothetical protein
MYLAVYKQLKSTTNNKFQTILQPICDKNCSLTVNLTIFCSTYVLQAITLRGDAAEYLFLRENIAATNGSSVVH